VILDREIDWIAATVPDERVDQKSLVGPPERIKQRDRAWASSGITSITMQSKQPEVAPNIWSSS